MRVLQDEIKLVKDTHADELVIKRQEIVKLKQQISNFEMKEADMNKFVKS